MVEQVPFVGLVPAHLIGGHRAEVQPVEERRSEHGSRSGFVRRDGGGGEGRTEGAGSPRLHGNDAREREEVLRLASGCSGESHRMTVGSRYVAPSSRRRGCRTMLGGDVAGTSRGDLRVDDGGDPRRHRGPRRARAAPPDRPRARARIVARRSASASAISGACAGVQTPEALMHERPPFAAMDATMTSRYCCQSVRGVARASPCCSPGRGSRRGSFCHGRVVATRRRPCRGRSGAGSRLRPRGRSGRSRRLRAARPPR